MKKQLRLIAKSKRNLLNIKELSEKIYNNLIHTEEYKKSKNILCYYSFGNEVCTIEYLKDRTKNWYLPKIYGEELKVCPYDKNKLSLNKYNILEPTTQVIKNLETIDMIIIPALTADKNGYRVGYGKGYYDRFLKTFKHSPCKVVLLFDELLIENVKPEPHDERCDIIVTDKDVYQIKC